MADAQQVVRYSGAVPGDRRSAAVTIANSEANVIATPGAGKRLVISGIVCGNTNATAANITFRNGTGGSTVLVLVVPASMTSQNYVFTPPIQLSVNKDFTAQGSAACSAVVAATGWVENA